MRTKWNPDRVGNHTWSEGFQQEEEQKGSPLCPSLASPAPALGHTFWMKCPHGDIASMKWQVLI